MAPMRHCISHLKGELFESYYKFVRKQYIVAQLLMHVRHIVSLQLRPVEAFHSIHRSAFVSVR